MTLDQQDVDAIARRTVELWREEVRQPSPVTADILTRAEAMAYVKRKSEGAFSDWCKAYRVKPYKRGRYSRAQLDVALSFEARKRAA